MNALAAGLLLVALALYGAAILMGLAALALRLAGKRLPRQGRTDREEEMFRRWEQDLRTKSA